MFSNIFFIPSEAWQKKIYNMLFLMLDPKWKVLNFAIKFLNIVIQVVKTILNIKYILFFRISRNVKSGFWFFKRKIISLMDIIIEKN